MNGISHKWGQRVVLLSIALIFFALPHTLEDFATGEPANAGVPAAVLATVISVIFSAQALGLYWLGQKQRRGLFVHIGIGLFWPIASGLAQLPTILDGTPYRAGFISVAYVAGMIVVGLLLFVSSLVALRAGPKASR